MGKRFFPVEKANISDAGFILGEDNVNNSWSKKDTYLEGITWTCLYRGVPGVCQNALKLAGLQLKRKVRVVWVHLFDLDLHWATAMRTILVETSQSALCGLKLLSPRLKAGNLELQVLNWTGIFFHSQRRYKVYCFTLQKVCLYFYLFITFN